MPTVPVPQISAKAASPTNTRYHLPGWRVRIAVPSVASSGKF